MSHKSRVLYHICGATQAGNCLFLAEQLAGLEKPNALPASGNGHADGVHPRAHALSLREVLHHRLAGGGRERLERLEAVRQVEEQVLHTVLLQTLLDRLFVKSVVIREEIGAISGNVAPELRADLQLVDEQVEVEARGNRQAGVRRAPEQLGTVGLLRGAADVFAVHPLELLDVELRRGDVDLLDVEELDHLLAREHLALVARVPAEEQQIVEDRLRQVAIVAELAHEGRAVALRVGLALRVDDHREMAVLRHGGAERLEDADVLEGVLDVVVAADDVGDALVDVVDDVGDVENRRAVGADDREVLDVLGLLRHVALDDVVELDRALLGHLEHHDRAGLAVARGLLARVGVAGGDELVDDLEVALHVLGLVEDLFIVVEAQPLHAVEEHRDGLRRGSLEVGVLDAQQELSARVAGEKPVVDGGADVADMDLARRRRGETNANV